MTSEDIAARADRALNRVTKWRALFAGWQLGTRSKSDAESNAVRDHRELSILLRVEVTALAGLLIRKGVFTQEEWTEAVADEADALNAQYEQRFPGCTATLLGLAFDPRRREEIETWMEGWKP